MVGVTLDHKICWEPQIKHVKASLPKTTAIPNSPNPDIF